jgi:hypothetical protein
VFAEQHIDAEAAEVDSTAARANKRKTSHRPLDSARRLPQLRRRLLSTPHPSRARLARRQRPHPLSREHHCPTPTRRRRASSTLGGGDPDTTSRAALRCRLGSSETAASYYLPTSPTESTVSPGMSQPSKVPSMLLPLDTIDARTGHVTPARDTPRLPGSAGARARRGKERREQVLQGCNERWPCPTGVILRGGTGTVSALEARTSSALP